MRKLLALAGAAGCGKSALGGHLKFSRDMTQLSFAAPIKYGIAAIFGLSSDELEEKKNTLEGPQHIAVTYRSLLQTLGTEWGRNVVDENIWIKIMRAKIEAIEGDIVITDLRFSNEADMVHELGGKVACITRTSATVKAEQIAHVSEFSLPVELVDTLIINELDLTDLWVAGDLAIYRLFE